MAADFVFQSKILAASVVFSGASLAENARHGQTHETQTHETSPATVRICPNSIRRLSRHFWKGRDFPHHNR